MKKSREQLLHDLGEQIQFLQTSADLFDSGIEVEAKRMAVAARILLYNSNSSTSILKQLDLQHQILFMSSANSYIPIAQTSYTGLFGLRVYADACMYIPACKRNGKPDISRYHDFSDWWNELVIDDKSYQFTRKDIVLMLANVDGGAHVDPNLCDEYADLIFENSIGWSYRTMDQIYPVDNNAACVTMRQIAQEILLSYSIFTRTTSFGFEPSEPVMAAYLPKKKLSGKQLANDEALYFFPKSALAHEFAAKVLIASSVSRTEERETHLETVLLTDTSTIRRLHIFPLAQI